MMLVSVVLMIFALSFEGFGSNGQSHNHQWSSTTEVHERSKRQIVPGTKWCGDGDRASNDSDLGHYRETDMCCREHDKCPMIIGGHVTMYGLTNPDSSTRCHCDCDRRFFDCLVRTTSGISHTIGRIYFNLLQKKCFREKECPVGKKCKVEYEWVDANKWLPSEEELNRLYYNIRLITPELEFD